MGSISYIIPSGWTGGPGYLKLREFLLERQVDILLLLPFDVFEDAYIDTLILGSTKHQSTDRHKVNTYSYPKKTKISSIENISYQEIPQNNWLLSDDKKFILNSEAIGLLQRLSQRQFQKLGDVCVVKRGVLFDKKLLNIPK